MTTLKIEHITAGIIAAKDRAVQNNLKYISLLIIDYMNNYDGNNTHLGCSKHFET